VTAWTRKRVQDEIGGFLRQYRRRAHRGMDPNDRLYDRHLEKVVKRMPPEDLQRAIDRELDDDEA
jgi:hypothetical protein